MTLENGVKLFLLLLEFCGQLLATFENLAFDDLGLLEVLVKLIFNPCYS